MMFQSYALFPHLNVFDNIAFPLRRRRMSKHEIRRLVGESLALVHLTGYERRFPHQLSGGQQQRVALARATVYGPPVLLMDEPLSALDKRLRQNMQEELRHLHRNLGTTVVYVTHDQDEALALSDKIALMRDGRIEQAGAPEDVYARPETLFTASFLGEANLLAVRVRDTSPGGLVALELPTGQIVEGTSIAAVRDGEPRVLVVRPENLRLTDDAERAVGISVAEAVYLGSSVRCVGTFETGERCVLTLDVAVGTELVRRGSGYVTWRAEDAVVVPAAEGTGSAGPARVPQLAATDSAAS
jgi:ABC-type Fe3+/spermidine/putrescine transport system ATPase subunit